MPLTIHSWYAYSGSVAENAPVAVDTWLKKRPPWRAADAEPLDRVPPTMSDAEKQRGASYITTSQDELDRINVALLLRKPLLVTGEPGLGKSTLVYSLAWRLGLGRPLVWAINSETTLKDGLYSYDAVSHLREGKDAPIGEYITLGPLGTALLPARRPRALLIDEIDKASFDLPNDLLRALEDGAFDIPELVRLGNEAGVVPLDAKGEEDRVPVLGGRVRRHEPPVVVITSNQERDLSPAFLRRCVQLELKRPDMENLTAIVRAQLGKNVSDARIGEAIDALGAPMTDMLLSAMFLRQGFNVKTNDIKDILKR